MTPLRDRLRLLASAQAARVGTARYAVVSAVDPTNHAVKVNIMPEDVESGWIPDGGFAAAGLRVSCPCEIGTHVLVESAEGNAEHPVIVARLFDATTLPPVSPVTGKPAQPGEWLTFNGNTFCHFQPGTVTTGIGSVIMTLTSTGLAVKGGTITCDHDIIAGTISLQKHVHQIPSGSNTDPPVDPSFPDG